MGRPAHRGASSRPPPESPCCIPRLISRLSAGPPDGAVGLQLQLRPPKGFESSSFGSASAGAGLEAQNTTISAAHIRVLAMRASEFRLHSPYREWFGAVMAKANFLPNRGIAHAVTACRLGRRIIRPPANAELARRASRRAEPLPRTRARPCPPRAAWTRQVRIPQVPRSIHPAWRCR